MQNRSKQGYSLFWNYTASGHIVEPLVIIARLYMFLLTGAVMQEPVKSSMEKTNEACSASGQMYQEHLNKSKPIQNKCVETNTNSVKS